MVVYSVRSGNVIVSKKWGEEATAVAGDGPRGGDVVITWLLAQQRINKQCCAGSRIHDKTTRRRPGPKALASKAEILFDC
jgi:hypothetical protein